MAPVRYVDDRELFEHRREGLNAALGFAGLELRRRRDRPPDHDHDAVGGCPLVLAPARGDDPPRRSRRGPRVLQGRAARRRLLRHDLRGHQGTHAAHPRHDRTHRGWRSAGHRCLRPGQTGQPKVAFNSLRTETGSRVPCWYAKRPRTTSTPGRPKGWPRNWVTARHCGLSPLTSRQRSTAPGRIGPHERSRLRLAHRESDRARRAGAQRMAASATIMIPTGQ
jgi:hypothetical protein